jgi:5-methyltetrahydropteroyltriglutamate--homocysteine methyltransferase
VTRPLFPATVVGSMPRPRFVRELLRPERREALGEAAFRRQLDAAVAYVIAMEEAAGLDIVSDGEWRRLSYIGVIADIARGFERTFRDGQSWHTVLEPLEVVAPGVIAEEVRFLRAHTERPVKVALPSPYLLGTRMWDEARSRDAYASRREFMEALVPILRRELELARDAGAAIVQLDDPHLCLFVDPAVRARYADPEEETRWCVELLNRIVEGVEGVKTAVHLCRRNKGRSGWVGEGGYESILFALSELKVDQLMMEFTIPVAGDVAVLEKLPERFEIGLGCVDCRSAHVDTPEEIVARVEKALAHVAPERILLVPDCGFAPGNTADIPLDEAFQKLQNEARAARILRDRYGGADE